MMDTPHQIASLDDLPKVGSVVCLYIKRNNRFSPEGVLETTISSRIHYKGKTLLGIRIPTHILCNAVPDKCTGEVFFWKVEKTAEGLICEYKQKQFSCHVTHLQRQFDLADMQQLKDAGIDPDQNTWQALIQPQ